MRFVGFNPKAKSELRAAIECLQSGTCDTQLKVPIADWNVSKIKKMVGEWVSEFVMVFCLDFMLALLTCLV